MQDTTNLIKLLPDYVANQIAAGEVVQRPANIVKELLENSVDAGATQLTLNISNGGKTSIEVIDNGCGISPLDMRMAFERHATSKIKEVEDLYKLNTMGFRGEALASIAAVAKVDVQSKTADAQAGTSITLERGEVTQESSCARQRGTTITVKNLFFYVPARKHFLKTDNTEFKHIVTEFTRIVLSYPSISFTLTHNKTQIYQLFGTTLKHRIIQLFGKSYEQQLIGLKETTEDLKIEGYLGKPAIAKKSAYSNYLIVNHRFVKCPLIHRAVVNAYANLIKNEEQPFYILSLELNPQNIDINIHPNKQEIKFADERWIFAFVQSHVKYTLAKNNIDQPLQFDLDNSIQSLPIVQTTKSTGTLKDSKLTSNFQQPGKAHYLDVDWKKEIKELIPEVKSHKKGQTPIQNIAPTPTLFSFKQSANFRVQQLLKGFLIVEQQDQAILIDQQAAHELILYNHFKNQLENAEPSVEHATMLTEPIIISLNPEIMPILEEYKLALLPLGFKTEQVGLQDIALYAIPQHIDKNNVENILLSCLEDIQLSKDNTNKKDTLAFHLSKTQAYKRNQTLSEEAQKQLVIELFKLHPQDTAPDGTITMKALTKQNIAQFIKHI